MSYFKYNGNEYVVKTLKLIAPMGVALDVPLSKIHRVDGINITNDVSIVVASGDEYHLLAEGLKFDSKTRELATTQPVRLLSKVVLKKALKPPILRPDNYQAPTQNKPYTPRRAAYQTRSFDYDYD